MPDAVIVEAVQTAVGKRNVALAATTLLHHMCRPGVRYNLPAMCEGGGQADATIFELL